MYIPGESGAICGEIRACADFVPRPSALLVRTPCRSPDGSFSLFRIARMLDPPFTLIAPLYANSAGVSSAHHARSN
jgi:hypothetical protein